MIFEIKYFRHDVNPKENKKKSYNIILHLPHDSSLHDHDLILLSFM